MKKTIPVILIISIIFLMLPIEATGNEIDSPYILEADKLNSLGLFLGTGEGYELLRVPRRAEAAVMLVRLLGMEDEADKGEFTHPFTDVPEWADPYVGYLYYSGLTKGVGDDLYDPYADVDARTYLTFLLRALGYSDDNDEFSWETAVMDALDIGLINSLEYEILESGEFTRGHMASLSYNALNSGIKDSDKTLAGELAVLGAIDEDTAANENFQLTVSFETQFLPYLSGTTYMPDLIGTDIDTAQILMRKSGIEIAGYEIEFNEFIPENHIVAQSCPALASSEFAENCILTISLGPSPAYHDELLEICRVKGWSPEITPYIIASAKYLIKNTVLNKYDVFKKLEINLNKAVILGFEDSAALGYSALYDASTRNIYFNRYMLDYNLVLHELAHAISNNIGTGKVGFYGEGNNTRIITEAFVESLSSKVSKEDSGPLNKFRAGDENIVFSSPSYFCDSDNNFALGVYSPLFILAGSNTIETMFFKDLSAYSSEVLKFNERYGEQMWKTLWNLADSFIGEPSFLSEDDRIAKASNYREYLNGIIECLNIDLEKAETDSTALRLLLFKAREIKESYPLGYSDFREKFNTLEAGILSMLDDNSDFTQVPGNGRWIIPDYNGKSPEYIYNSLTIAGEASGIGYMVIAGDEDQTGVAGVVYKEPGMPTDEAVELIEGDTIQLGGEYIILIYDEKVPDGGYALMRDLVHDFSRYLADYDKISDYVVTRLLRNEGFDYRFELTYFDHVSTGMQGRIVNQFPNPGAVIIPGQTVIRIFMVKQKPYYLQ